MIREITPEDAVDRICTIDQIPYDIEKLQKFYEKVKDHAVDYSSLRKRATKGLFKSIKVDDLEDGGSFLHYPEVAELVEKFNPITQPITHGNIAVTVYQPGFLFHPHIDFSRRSCIMFPIFPTDGGALVDYYDNEILGEQPKVMSHGQGAGEHDEEYYLGSFRYSNTHANIMNVEKVHGVRNVGSVASERVYLQISIYDDYQTCMDRMKPGEFLNI
jgi:hypothetical protein